MHSEELKDQEVQASMHSFELKRESLLGCIDMQKMTGLIVREVTRNMSSSKQTSEN